MGDLRNAVEEFKKNIKNEKLKELKSIQDKGTIEVAVELAYDDAKRTMTGIGAHKDERKEAQGEIVEKLHSYFALSTAPDCNKFDELHKEMCELWHKRFEDIDNLGTYGKAQKIVNMAFKYLYCCEDANTKEEYFKYCHVALDSYTLEWFFREAGNKTDKIVKKYISSWSSIKEYGDNTSKETYHLYVDGKDKEYYTYMFYQKNFRVKYSTPFKEEFVKWQYYKEKLIAEDFLQSLSGNTIKREYIKKDNLKNIYFKIKEQIEVLLAN